MPRSSNYSKTHFYFKRMVSERKAWIAALKLHYGDQASKEIAKEDDSHHPAHIRELKKHFLENSDKYDIEFSQRKKF